MQKIIFFDTETTGNTEKDFLCQIAYKTDSENFVGLYKPPIKVPAEASAVHHITNKILEDKPAFKESNDFLKIKELFENKNAVLVAHNAPFDLMIIKKEDIVPANFICTLRLARYLDPDEKIEKYNLQYLRYFLDIEIDATAHDALGDVLVLEKLFERLKNKIMSAPTLEEVGVPTASVGKELTETEAIDKMIEISSHPSLLRTFNFGKHVGKKIEEVLQTNRDYLEWLLAEKLKSDQEDEDW